MARAAISILFCFIACWVIGGSENTSDNNPLQRQIAMEPFSGKREQAMEIMAHKGNFHFSYNPLYINVTAHTQINEGTYSVELLLGEMFRGEVEYQLNGKHIILLPAKKKKASGNTNKPKKQKPEATLPKPKQYTISGTITNSQTGEIIADVTVYESNKLLSTLSDNSGNYNLTVSAENELVPIAVSKKSFYDTVIVVEPSSIETVDISLRPIKIYLVAKPNIEIKIEGSKENIDTLGAVEWLVPESQRAMSQNLGYELKRPAQISFLPYISSNRRMSGNTVNNLSINVLGGYAAGTNGVELGGFMNINRKQMNGLQAAGFGNITGGQVKGVQLAGFFNHNGGSTHGFQAAGFHNLTYDTMKGVQMAGFANVLHGKMMGMQAAGFANITSKDVDGLQIAGFGNTSGGDVKLMQISGFGNYAKNVGGSQIAGFANYADGSVGGVQVSAFMNLASQKVGGAQISGFINMANEVNKLQLSSVMNITSGSIHGAQIAGLMNITQDLDGTQFGLLNFADSVSEKGIPIGFFSYVNNGYHSLGVSISDYGVHHFEFKTGLNKFYNIFGLGYGLHEVSNVLSFEYGIGHRGDLRNWLVYQIEGTFTQIAATSVSTPRFNTINSLSFGFEFLPTKYLSFEIGPSFRHQLYDNSIPGIQPEFGKNKIASATINDTMFDAWVGWETGLKVIF
ncbi:MAG: hypothetical protein KDC92_06800 [Bacteroidetes bacterium]|nr:hypothetical protein [Bacteroidota bacterium]